MKDKINKYFKYYKDKINKFFILYSFKKENNIIEYEFIDSTTKDVPIINLYKIKPSLNSDDLNLIN